MNVITFPPKNQPDPKHVCTDAQGVTWYEFAVDFADDDNVFSFRIWAKNNEDAERRVQCIKESAFLKGKIFGEIEDV